LCHFQAGSGDNHFVDAPVAYFIDADRIFLNIKIIPAISTDTLQRLIVNIAFKNGFLCPETKFLQKLPQIVKPLGFRDIVCDERNQFFHHPSILPIKRGKILLDVLPIKEVTMPGYRFLPARKGYFKSTG